MVVKRAHRTQKCFSNPARCFFDDTRAPRGSFQVFHFRGGGGFPRGNRRKKEEEKGEDRTSEKSLRTGSGVGAAATTEREFRVETVGDRRNLRRRLRAPAASSESVISKRRIFARARANQCVLSQAVLFSLSLARVHAREAGVSLVKSSRLRAPKSFRSNCRIAPPSSALTNRNAVFSPVR